MSISNILALHNLKQLKYKGNFFTERKALTKHFNTFIPKKIKFTNNGIEKTFPLSYRGVINIWFKGSVAAAK